MSNQLKCKCCGAPTKFMGEIDFNRTCHDRIKGRVFPVSEIKIPYFSCTNCSFTFTPYMDNWSMEDFKNKIYNDEYFLADGALPGYENAPIRETISYQNGVRLSGLLEGAQKDIRVLDYGAGGNPGPTGLAFVDKGFDLYSYEPHFADTDSLPSGKFDFIYLIEVIEHCHDLDLVARFLSERVARDGLIHIQTLLHPFPVQNDVLNSWYIAPRNGHISIFTFEALAVLFRRYKINIVKTIHGVVGFKEKPRFMNQFLI